MDIEVEEAPVRRFSTVNPLESEEYQQLVCLKEFLELEIHTKFLEVLVKVITGPKFKEFLVKDPELCLRLKGQTPTISNTIHQKIRQTITTEDVKRMIAELAVDNPRTLLDIAGPEGRKSLQDCMSGIRKGPRVVDVHDHPLPDFLVQPSKEQLQDPKIESAETEGETNGNSD